MIINERFLRTCDEDFFSSSQVLFEKLLIDFLDTQYPERKFSVYCFANMLSLYNVKITVYDDTIMWINDEGLQACHVGFFFRAPPSIIDSNIISSIKFYLQQHILLKLHEITKKEFRQKIMRGETV